VGRWTLERFHFHAILENLFAFGCGASAPINIGLRGLLTIRLDIFSASREIETVLVAIERCVAVNRDLQAKKLDNATASLGLCGRIEAAKIA
jgi:hypothetical protein